MKPSLRTKLAIDAHAITVNSAVVKSSESQRPKPSPKRETSWIVIGTRKNEPRPSQPSPSRPPRRPPRGGGGGEPGAAAGEHLVGEGEHVREAVPLAGIHVADAPALQGRGDGVAVDRDLRLLKHLVHEPLELVSRGVRPRAGGRP